MDGFRKKKQPSILNLRKDEWRSFAGLLTKGYPILDALTLLEKDTDAFVEHMQSGETLEKIIEAEADTTLRDHICFFMQFQGVAEAILCADRMHRFTTQMKQKILSQAAYPIFLLCFSYGTLYIFCVFVIPQMQSGFSQYLAHDWMNEIMNLVRLSIWLIGILLFVILCFLIALKVHASFRMFMIPKLTPYIPIISSYFSYLLAGYLGEMHRSGMSTRISFLYLSTHHHMDIVRFIASDVHEQLQKGNTLQSSLVNPFIHHRLLRHIAIGSADGNLDASLQDYMEIQENNWLRGSKRLSIIIQLVAYSFVAVVAICVYRMMLIPLELLNNF